MQTRSQIVYAWVRPVGAGLPDPDPRLFAIIRDWARKRGRNFPSYWEMSHPDEQFAQFCADPTRYSSAQTITRLILSEL
jgi:hypothetical protein